MHRILQEEQFQFLSEQNKAFLCAFDEEMTRLGYDFGGKIGSGYCWGKYMVIYTKTGVKSKKVYARVYLREDGMVLRLFFSDIDKHRVFIERAPSHVKEVFVGPRGNCRHCHNDREGRCPFRKTYTIDDRLIEKCNGETFEFLDPSVEKLQDYVSLFTAFYPPKKAAVR